MKTFSRLNVLTLLFLSIVWMRVEGTGYAESLEVLILEGQTGIGDPVGVRFVVDPAKVVILRVDAVGVEITGISGATAPYAIPGNYATDAEAGTLLVEGRIRSSGAYISAVWDREADDDLSAIAQVPNAVDIVLDAMKGILYWTSARGKIRRINVSGEGFDGNFITNLNSPKHIAFDVKNRRLYWTDRRGIWNIYSDNDTGTPRRLGTEDLGEVRGIAVYDDGVYWTEQTNGSGSVRFMNRNGRGSKKLLASLEEIIPGGIAVDAIGRKVYWTTADGEIQNMSLTGTTIQTVVMRGAGSAAGIALGGTAAVAASPAAPSVSSVGSVENALLANYPNPFNPETWIPYELSVPADVSVSIYSVNGHLVRRLDLGHQSAGVYRSRNRAAYWDGRNVFGERVASGLYFYTLTAGDFTATRKMLIRK